MHVALISLSKRSYSEMVENKDMQLFMENLKMKKGQKIFELPEWAFETQIFSNFPAHNLNLYGR